MTVSTTSTGMATSTMMTPPQQQSVVECSPIKVSKGRDVAVQLQYLKHDTLYETTKPVQYTPAFADLEGRSNVYLTPGPPEILHDVRDAVELFSLNENGFKYVKAPTTFKEWSSQPKIAQDFLPEMEALLKREIDGCDEVMFYDARLRQGGSEGVRVEGLSYNPFARQVHTDNTDVSVLAKIHNLTEMKAEFLLSGRARIINIWRPIKHPVYDTGLAICDGGKITEKDVMECDRRRSDTGEYWDTMGVVQYRPGFDWYYMSEQAEEDVLLFKNYDSATNVQARQCLHTAFDMPPDSIPPGAPTRESIEVRALIFTYPKDTRKPSWITPSQHPLAITLEASKLKRLDDEHCITDRVRTDIDESNEIKDAVLLLRKKEIKRLEQERDALTSERDALLSELTQAKSDRYQMASELEKAREQSLILTGNIEDLQAEVQALRSHVEETPSHQLSPQLSDASPRSVPSDPSPQFTAHPPRQSHRRGGSNDSLGPAERTNFMQTIERQQQEIEKWKAEAIGRGHEAVSYCWQASVDEAVRRERAKDQTLVDTLWREVARLEGRAGATSTEDPQYKALYDFVAQTSNELSLKKNEIIVIIQKKSNGWWLGRRLDHTAVGWTPAAYLE